jgi:predicted 3-demethylubiquinone-9 3-methyltransferase (glyoxalase superfamily)
MQKVTPFLWFDGNIEEAVSFYVSLFKNSSVDNVMRKTPDGPWFMASFQLDGQHFQALNGGPMFKFTEAFSMYVNCESQAEVDDLWEKLTASGGAPIQCGWLKDQFGLTWQIVPSALPRLLLDPDPVKADRVMQAMLPMSKIDIATLEKAHAG